MPRLFQGTDKSLFFNPEYERSGYLGCNKDGLEILYTFIYLFGFRSTPGSVQGLG